MCAHDVVKRLVVIMVTGLVTVCATADDWPNWRGPQHNGISAEVHWGGNWAACEPNVLWVQQVGTGFSSVAVADNRLYTMGNTNETDEVFCLDPNTGEILWVHQYPSALEPKQYEGGPGATPTVAGGRLYTLSKHGIAYCLDANDGAVVWQRDLVTECGVSKPTWGFAGSPFIDANLVIYNAGTHGTALRASDGALVWGTGGKPAGYSTPVPFDWREQRFLALMGERSVAAVHARTGEVLWEHPWVAPQGMNIADPVVDSNLVFVSTGWGKGSTLLDIATGQTTELWVQKNVQTALNSAVLWQGYLYAPNDNGKAVTCLERRTGDVIWSQAGFGNGSLTFASGKLIILSEAGELRIAEASPEGYRERGRGRILTGKCWSVPVLANGKIYARNARGRLVCVKLETTAPKVDAGGNVITSLKAGVTTVQLSGTVTDDTGDVTTIRWSVISSPPGATADIANDSTATTTVTFTQAGLYVLELYAIDATGQEGTDYVEITVYDESPGPGDNDLNSGHAAHRYDSADNDFTNCRDITIIAAE